MKQILWFRRDLRISDNSILANANGEVLPIFIFDVNILGKLQNNDKRVTFIYQSVLKLKKDLRSMGLDLAIFYGVPKEIFKNLLTIGFNEVLVSIDNDDYAKQRDLEIESMISMRRFNDSFILEPKIHLKNDGTPYRVFTPFYNYLFPIWSSDKLEEHIPSKNMSLMEFDYSHVPTLAGLGFVEQKLPDFLHKSADDTLKEFIRKLDNYKNDRDFWYIDGTSNMSVYLRFGLISPRQIFNHIKPYSNSDFYIRELFWREFYNYILVNFPTSQTTNFIPITIEYKNNTDEFERWKNGTTGVPIVDAAMIHLNETGMMPNRLRMIVSSYLCKNLLIDWRWGEEYFASKLLDYEASSNVGSWQWAASTGADSVPYFRIFNPYLQSAKFDKDAVFIKQHIPILVNTKPSIIHKEQNGSNLFREYISPIVSITYSKDRAIKAFKRAKNSSD